VLDTAFSDPLSLGLIPETGASTGHGCWAVPLHLVSRIPTIRTQHGASISLLNFGLSYASEAGANAVKEFPPDVGGWLSRTKDKNLP
jgi:hypothetical protein